MGAFRFHLALLLGVLVSAEISAAQPPTFIEGPDGFFFVLVTDSNGKPVLTNDGSPLYDGSKKFGDKSLRISLSLTALEKKLIAEKADSVIETPWAKKALHLSVGQGLIQRFIEDYRDKPEDFLKLFKGMTRDKAEILRRILFEDRVSLEVPLQGDRQNEPGFINIQALQRNAKNPSPEKIKVRFPVEGTPFYIRASSEWYVEVELDHLSFDFESKTIEFDPVTNSFRITLNCKGALIKGPTVQVGRWRELHKYSEGKHWYGSYHLEDNYLLKGEVGPLSLTLSLQLYRDGQGYWRIRLIRPESQPDSPGVALIPKVQPTDVVLNYEKDVRDGKTGAKTKSQAFGLSPRILAVINGVVSDMLDDALGGVLFPEDLAFSFELKNPFDVSDPGLARLETRLSDLKVGPADLSLFFDARLKGLRASRCLKQLSPHNLTFDPVQELQSLSDSSFDPWKLVTKKSENQPGDKWEVSDLSNEDLLVRVSPPFFDLVSLGGFVSGAFCASSLWWWPRPGAIPPAQFSLSEPPKFVLGENAIAFDVSGLIQVQNRLTEPFPHFEANQSAELEISGKVDIVHSRSDRSLTLQGISTIRLPGHPTEEKLLKDVFLGLYPGKEGEPQWTYDHIRSLFSKFPLFFSDLQLASDGVRLIFNYKSPSNDPGEEALTPRSTEEPFTTFVLDPHLGNSNSEFVTIKWTSNVPRAFYSWRWRYLSDQAWSPWTAFEERSSVTLSAKRPGKYEFQVLGMNSYFKIERYPKQFDFNKRNATTTTATDGTDGPTGGGPVIDEGDGDTTDIPATKKPKRAADGGAFGCALNIKAEGESQSLPGQNLNLTVLILLLLGLVFGARQGALGLGQRPLESKSAANEL